MTKVYHLSMAGKELGAELTEVKVDDSGDYYYWQEHKSTTTTIPFIKNNEFDYSWFGLGDYTWILYIILVIIIVTAVSNGANLTGWLDGLAT